MKRRTIWNDIYFQNIEDWDFSYEEEEEGRELTEEEKYERAIDLNTYYLDDERINLNVELPEDIICIADLGLWYGRRSGYRLLGNNLNEIFRVYDDYNDYYCDTWNVKMRGIHHDGTNEYLFRMFREGLSEEQKDNFLDKIYNGTATSKDLTHYTKSIRPYVAEVYGW